MQAATQQAESYAADICVGRVTSVSPLKVKIQNGLELTDDFLTLTSHCKETWINIPKHDEYEHSHEIDAETEYALAGVQGQATEPAIGHKHKIKITTKTALPKILLWRGLQVDDHVLLLKLPPYNFIVLERLAGITNDPKDGE